MDTPTIDTARTAATTDTVAAVRNAVKVYGKGDTAVRAIDGIDLDLPRGGFTAIMGPSGSGKSTLMHCMAGLDSLTDGEATIGGERLDQMKDSDLTKLRRRRVGFIFQAFNLIPTLTAKDNIELPLRLDGASVDRDWFDEVTRKLGIHERLDHTPAELSGGQVQRVAVARALVARPDVIFADEPTGNLDTQSGAEVLRLMRAAVDDLGQTIVMVTHDANAASIADRVLFLVDGHVVEEMANPTADAIYERLAHLATTATRVED